MIYKTILRPIFLYGSECWTLNTAQKSKMKEAEIRVLRVIRGVSRRDRLRSGAVREDLNVEPILECVERNQLRWFGHIKRRQPGDRLRSILDWRPDGRRKARRPRKRWMDSVSEAVQSKGRTLREVEEWRSYEDRDQW